jgi:hypothetical protein
MSTPISIGLRAKAKHGQAVNAKSVMGNAKLSTVKKTLKNMRR